MGCFSYICPKCGDPIYSDKYGNCIGEEVRLARLVKGKVVECMKGRYNAYGRVHRGEDSSHILGSSSGEEIKIFDNSNDKEHNWVSIEWSEFVDEQYNDDSDTGIVAIHEKCWDGSFGETISEGDPDQGWRDYENDVDEKKGDGGSR